jgi:hypothetical protein
MAYPLGYIAPRHGRAGSAVQARIEAISFRHNALLTLMPSKSVQRTELAGALKLSTVWCAGD